eukprot:3238430-Prymnesium_polylepis.1
MPAVSLHAHMKVEVNIGQDHFTVRDDNAGQRITRKEPPGSFNPILRASKMRAVVGAADAEQRGRRRQRAPAAGPMGQRPEGEDERKGAEGQRVQILAASEKLLQPLREVDAAAATR